MGREALRGVRDGDARTKLEAVLAPLARCAPAGDRASRTPAPTATPGGPASEAPDGDRVPDARPPAPPPAPSPTPPPAPETPCPDPQRCAVAPAPSDVAACAVPVPSPARRR